MRARQGFCAFLAGCMAVAAVPLGGGTTVFGGENGTLANGELTQNADGWTIGGDFASESDSYGCGFSDGYLSVWTGEGTEADFSLTQTVTNMTKGDYYARVAIVGQGSKGASESQDKLTLTLTDDTTSTSQSRQLICDGWDNWDNTQETAPITVNEGDSVTFTISGRMAAGDWYGLKNAALLVYTEAVDAPITVKKVDGLSEDFIHGVDVSTYLSVVQSGAKYYDENGNEAELFDLMEAAGINYVRLRVWNSPYPLDSEGNQIYVEEDGTTEHAVSEIVSTQTDKYGGTRYFLSSGTEVYLETYGAGVCDVETAAVIGKIATEHHMRVLIDYHYSDFWADPNKKTVPKTWKTMTLEQKTEALETFTRESLTTLRDAGVDVGMVQVGNEINNGMAGETSHEDVITLLKAGSKAIRSVSQDILVAVHFTDPHNEGYQLGRAKELDDAGLDYDAFGTSYYPFWHGTTAQLYEDLNEIATTYNKKVYVAEISYPWTLKDGDGAGNNVSESAADMDFNYTIDAQGEGQAAAVRDAIEAVSKIGANGLGTFYWEPAWIPVQYAYKADGTLDEEIYKSNVKKWMLHGSGWATKYAREYDAEVTSEENGGSWDNQAFFDFDGHVLPSINVYKWVYTGASGPTRVATVDSSSIRMNYGTTPQLPEKAAVNLNDGTSLEAAVTWDSAQVEALKTADYGDYTVDGSVGAFSYESKGETFQIAAGTWTTTCAVTVTGETNYVTNGSFETGDASGWTLTNYLGEGAANPHVDPGSANAKEGTYYYTVWNEGDIDLSLDQTITTSPKAGKYMLFAYYQGTHVKEVSKNAGLYAEVTYNDGTTKRYEASYEIPNTWKVFYQAKVPDIIINDNVTKIAVGTRLACSAEELGAWMVVDDISLMPTGELTAEEAAYGAKSESGDGTKTETKTYTIKYNVNGGNKLSTASKKVTYGKTYGKLASPVRKGYTFAGWYTKKSGGKQIKSTTKVTITKTTTIYAHWTKVSAPAQVKSVTAKNVSGKKAKITYKKVSGAKGYVIRYSTSSKMKNASSVTSTSTSKTINKLKKGSTYYVQVRAYKLDSAGNKVYSKSYSSKVKVTIKK